MYRNAFYSLLLLSPALTSQAPVDEPSTTSAAPTATSVAPAIYTNKWAVDCAVQGTAAPNYLVQGGWTATADVLACQYACRYTTYCQSFGWNPSASLCGLFAAPLLPDSVVPGNTTTFFSTKIHDDLGQGSPCYSSSPIPAAPTGYPFSDNSPVYAQPWVRDCAIEGSPGPDLSTEYHFTESNILNCQTRCLYTTSCISWAWNTKAPAGKKCTWFNSWIDPSFTSSLSLINRGSTGMYFSDRYAATENKTSCFSSTPVPLPPSIFKDSPLYAKTWVPDCVRQGTPSVAITSRFFWEYTATGALECQLLCRYTTACISWAWNTTATINCGLYNAWGSGEVTPAATGTWYSDKYPGDGSDSCFSSTVLSSGAKASDGFLLL